MSSVQRIDVPTPGGTADAVLALPDGDGRHPGLLMFMDAFGLRPRIEEMAARFADAGHVVLAPNVFHRAGRSPLFDLTGLEDAANRDRIFAQVMPVMRALTPAEAMADAGAYLDALAAHPRVAPGPAGTVGYCMGGVLALRTASAYGDRVAAVATYHAGNVATDAEDSAHRGFGGITAEVYMAHADHDGSMDADQRQRVAEALEEAGVRHAEDLYAGATHGFTMADTAAYDPEAEARHWRTALHLFGRTLPQG